MLLAIKGDTLIKKSLQYLIRTINSAQHWYPKSYIIFVVQSLQLSKENEILRATITC